MLADDAQLTTPFVGLALVPEAASSLLLTARIGHARAFAMFALGQAVGAADALAWGLAKPRGPRAPSSPRRWPPPPPQLARQPLGAMIATKRLMRDARALTQQMELENRAFLERLRSPEALEAFTAFAERRAPNFT